jgi:hypothetical protein
MKSNLHFSKPWNFSGGFSQGLEKYGFIFPSLGKAFRQISMARSFEKGIDGEKCLDKNHRRLRL